MYGTYHRLLELAGLYEEEETNCELAIKYQVNEDPIYLAVIYCRYFAYIKSTAGRYFNITDADKESYALEELHKSMLDYKITGGAKVQTLFITYYNNRLRAETQSMNLQKRAANNNCEDFEETAEIFNGYIDDEINIIELSTALDQMEQLTENEKMYCKIVIQTDEIKDIDIAKQLGISSSAIFQLKKRLAKKLDYFNIAMN